MGQQTVNQRFLKNDIQAYYVSDFIQSISKNFSNFHFNFQNLFNLIVCLFALQNIHKLTFFCECCLEYIVFDELLSNKMHIVNVSQLLSTDFFQLYILFLYLAFPLDNLNCAKAIEMQLQILICSMQLVEFMYL